MGSLTGRQDGNSPEEIFSKALEKDLSDSGKLKESSKGGEGDEFAEPGKLGVRQRMETGNQGRESTLKTPREYRVGQI